MLLLQAILLEQPRVISAKVGHAWDLPENAFVAAYAKSMGSRNFSPDDRTPVRFMETDEFAYSALNVIEFEQMYLPMCLISVIGGTARFHEKQRQLFFQHYFPRAIRAGAQCTDLMCVYYERHFHEDLEDVRRKWGIIPGPKQAC
ncbi:Ubiquinone biosynthesis protein Coq [Parasponia andersonii]|uniref:Ubiquinone biosynthesis protein Coq n=1 Tax=Parasponia andersonii TaxID=3476 RepID=A0A2P5E2E9_PARAD|nr:Ubiquinone biosynthesis protein Coq [Parasponia andersonii]